VQKLNLANPVGDLLKTRNNLNWTDFKIVFTQNIILLAIVDCCNNQQSFFEAKN